MSRTKKGRKIIKSSTSSYVFPTSYLSIYNVANLGLRSPYCTQLLTLHVRDNGEAYQIHEGVLSRYPELADACPLKEPFDMREEVGHTLIHYLYTGKYEALGSDVSADKIVKLEGIAQLYGIAVKYNITGLSEILPTHVQVTAKTVNIFDVLDIARTVHQILEKENDWFTMFLKTEIKAALVVNKDLFMTSRFLHLIGKVKIFDRVLMRTVAEIYNEKIAMQARLLQDTICTPGSPSISSLDDAPQQPQDFEESHLCQEVVVPCDESTPCEVVVASNDDHILCKEATLSCDEPTSCEEAVAIFEFL